MRRRKPLLARGAESVRQLLRGWPNGLARWPRPNPTSDADTAAAAFAGSAAAALTEGDRSRASNDRMR